VGRIDIDIELDTSSEIECYVRETWTPNFILRLDQVNFTIENLTLVDQLIYALQQGKKDYEYACSTEGLFDNLAAKAAAVKKLDEPKE
jgi:hypothetical protein